MLNLGDRIVQGAGVAGPFLPDGQRTASSRWVRPILTTPAHFFAFASMASRSRFSAGIVLAVAIVYAAICISVGNVSLDDCPMFM